MNITHGMDADEVEDLGVFLQQRADRLRQIAHEINTRVYSSVWDGEEARMFNQQRWPRHRAQLLAAADHLHALGQSARNNAAEQRDASQPGAAAPAGAYIGAAGAAGLAGSIGTALSEVSDRTSMAGPFFSILGDVKHVPGARAAGGTFSAFGYFTEGYSIGEELAVGRYGDAAFDSAFVAGDLGADALKTKGHVGYAAGVAVQTWVEVGREARNVDWSPEGMRQLREASLQEWGSAFGEALTKMPTRLVKIFSF